MKAQIDLSFNQILDVVRRLPREQKIKLSKELESEAIDSKLSLLLAEFKTESLSMDEITRVVENEREKQYAERVRD